MTNKVKYEVSGMTCGGCQRSIVAALKRVGVDVDVDDVSLADGTLTVDAAVQDDIVRRAVDDAGFEVGRRLGS